MKIKHEVPTRQQFDALKLKVDNLSGGGGTGGGTGGGAVNSVAGKTGDVTLTASDVGLGDIPARVTALEGRAQLDVEQVQDILGQMLGEAQGHYDDAAGTYTLNLPAGGALDPEQVQDIAGAMIKAGTNTTVAYNDAAGTLTVSASGGAVSSVAGRTGVVTLTKADVGLSNVTNDAQVKRSEMGAASGVATLGADGKVPAAQLPAGTGGGSAAPTPGGTIFITAPSTGAATTTHEIYNLHLGWQRRTVNFAGFIMEGNVTPTGMYIGFEGTEIHYDISVLKRTTSGTGNAMTTQILLPTPYLASWCEVRIGLGDEFLSPLRLGNTAPTLPEGVTWTSSYRGETAKASITVLEAPYQGIRTVPTPTNPLVTPPLTHKIDSGWGSRNTPMPDLTEVVWPASGGKYMHYVSFVIGTHSKTDLTEM